LVDHGIDGVTVAAVAARAGLHETSVYRRWRTRKDLIVDALLDRSETRSP
jgi:AcrR family transcriptional regulator